MVFADWSEWRASGHRKGRYDVRLTIDTTSPIERWLGGPLIPEDAAKAKAALQSLYDEVPKFRWVSKAVQIVVE